MNAARWTTVAAALLAAAAGCTFNPTIPPGRVSCHKNSDCTSGFICTDHPALPKDAMVCCATAHCARDTGVVLPGIGNPDGSGSGGRGSGGSDGATADREGSGGTAGEDANNIDAGSGGAGGSGGNAGSGGTAGADGGPGDTGPSCMPACTVGLKKCGTGGGVETCGMVNGCAVWSPEVACPTPQSCASGDCVCPAPPAGCTNGAGSFCMSGTVVGTCAKDALGCVSLAGTTNCPAGKPCTGQHPSANCSCPAPPAACAAGAGSSCQNNVQVTCALDGNGCLAVSAMVTCTATKPCTGTAPNAACTCPTAPSDCGSPGTVCRPGNVLATCGKNSDGCLVTTGTMTCPGIKTCSGFHPSASCVCPSPPAACNGQSSGSFCASATSLATCAADANGCVVAPAVSCANGCMGAFPSAGCCAATPGQSCGSCGGVTQCDGSCTKPLAPDCNGKACGASDGCGGTCSAGSCPGGGVCTGSPPHCVTPTQSPLLVGAANGPSLKAYDPTTGTAAPDFISGGPTISGASALAMGGAKKNLFMKGWSAPNNAINEYDGRTGVWIRTLSATMTTPSTPGSALIIGPDGLLYSSDTAGGISRWNPDSGASLGTFIAKSAGGLEAVGGLRFGPDGNLYVGSYSYLTSHHQVLRFNNAGAFLGTFIPSGAQGLQAPTDLIFSPNGSVLFVASEGSGQLLSFNASTGAFIGPAVAVAGLYGLAYGPDGRLYGTSMNNSQVIQFDGTTGAMLKVFATNTYPAPSFLLFSQQ